MTRDEFRSLLSGAPCEVLLMASPVSFPFPFALHTWLIVVRHGAAHRYDVWGTVGRCKPSWGHVHQDLYEPWVGVRIFPSAKADPDAARFNARLIARASGEDAERLARFIEENSPRYPFAHEYRWVPGPNSNTYTAWVLANVPTPALTLPWNAFGKGYARRLIAS